VILALAPVPDDLDSFGIGEGAITGVATLAE